MSEPRSAIRNPPGQFTVRRYWPELVVALAPVAVFWRLVVGGQVLYWGLPALQFVPWRSLANDALMQGRLPLWTPLLGMGAPLMANHQSAVFYPPNLLALILPPDVAISILAVLHLSFAGVGMVRLARRPGLGDFAGAVTGLAFGLSGYLTGRLWFITINNAIAWLPWIVLASTPRTPLEERAGGEGGKPIIKYVLTLSILLALQLLAGHAQSTFYTLLLAGAWLTWHSLFGSRPPRPFQLLLANYIFFALAVLFAVCISSIQLIPTYELLQESPRASAAEYDFAMTYSLWPWRFFTWLAPNFFGHPADGNFWGYGAYWEDNAYLGLVPIIFAGYALIHRAIPGDHVTAQTRVRASAISSAEYTDFRRFVLAICDNLRKSAGKKQAEQLRDRGEQNESNSALPANSAVMFSVLTILVSTLLALGKNTPIFPFLYRHIPGFDLFQAPARMLVWYTFGVSLLAGIGAGRWRASERKRYWSRLGIAGSLVLLASGIAGRILLSNPRAATFGTGLAWAALFAAATFVFILRQPNPLARPPQPADANHPTTQPPSLWHLLTLAFIAIDLGLAAARLNPTTDRTLYTLKSDFTLDEGRIFQYADDEYRVKFRDFFRFKSFDPLDAQALRDSFLPNLPALDGLASANNFDPLVPARYAAYLEAMESNPQLMNLADVKAIVKPMGVISMRPEKTSRLRVVYDARTVDSGDAAFAALTSPTFDPDFEVILEPASPVSNLPALALDPNRFTAAVTLDRDGYVVLSDTYYPGWRAFVDGRPQPILRADYAFRAVAVPAGTHTVAFEYAPFSVTLGLIISLAALFLWLALAASAICNLKSEI